MQKAITHLGNKELHRRHSVMIEGGNVPRARVMTQIIIDKYLMRGLIDLIQHQAGEYLYRQAGKAGIWPTGANWKGTGKGVGNYVPFGAFPYGRTLSLVDRELTWFHSYLVAQVVCQDFDVSEHKLRMKCLLEALDLIAARKLRSPVRRFKKIPA